MKKTLIILASSVILSMSLLLGCGDKSVEDEDYRLVKVEQCDGDLSLERNNDTLDVSEGMMLQPKDTMYIGDSSEALFLVDSDKHIIASDNTGITINAKGDENSGKVKIELLYGNAMFVIDNKLNDDSTFEVETPNATLSVRGTTFQVAYDRDTNTTYVEVSEGVVYADYEGNTPDEEIVPGQVRVISEDTVYDYVDGSIWDMAFDLLEMPGTDNADYADASGNASDVNSTGEFASVDGDACTQYNNIVANMYEFIQTVDRLQAEYDAYDYMIYDYDLDGEKEVILYLRYNDSNNKFMLDLCFLDYTPESGVYVRAVNTGDVDDSCFYADYNGVLARYSWTTNPMQSYIYYIDFTGDGSLIYILDSAYDEIFVNYEEYGLKPCAIYGEWEMILSDQL